MDLDHFNIRTQKLAETQHFYEQILGLTAGARPAQPLNGAWLYNDRQAVLHLLESAPSSLATGPLDHVAFACTGLGALLARLDREGIARLRGRFPAHPSCRCSSSIPTASWSRRISPTRSWRSRAPRWPPMATRTSLN